MNLPSDFQPCVEVVSKVVHDRLMLHLEQQRPDPANITLNATLMSEWNRIERLRQENAVISNRYKAELQDSLRKCRERMEFYNKFI